MRLKKLLSLIGDTIKDIEMSRILDKLNKKFTLTSKENKFLKIYSPSSDDDKDLMYLSKNTTFKKVKDLLDKNRIVICDLHDRDGKIGLQIVSVSNNIEEEICEVALKGGTKHQLHDKFLYNLIYNGNKDLYSLQEQDEYFEKIEVKK